MDYKNLNKKNGNNENNSKQEKKNPYANINRKAEIKKEDKKEDKDMVKALQDKLDSNSKKFKEEVTKDFDESSNKSNKKPTKKPKKDEVIIDQEVEMSEEEKLFYEEYERWLKQCHLELVDAGKEFEKLGMKVTVHNVSEKNSLPVLVIVLRENGDEILAVDLSFSPFERQSLEETKWLQIGVEFPWDILSQDQQRFMGLINKINTYIPVGHFSLIEEILYYRFVCSIPKTMKVSSMPVLESISVISVFAANYEEVFRNYLINKISFQDLYNLVTEGLQ